MAVSWMQGHVEELARQAVMRTIVRIITDTHDTAVQRIMNPPKSGKVYRTRGVSHQASAPGEAPANETGRLANSGVPTYNPAELYGSLRFATAYALPLEKGTLNMAPRPFLLNSFIESAADRNRMLAQEMRAVGLGGGAGFTVSGP